MLTQIELLKKYKLPVRGRWGQHLLVDANIARKIVRLVSGKAGDPLLEIGPGLGALTGLLLERGFQVCGVEKDPRFVPILEKEWGRAFPGQLTVVQDDCLKMNLQQLRKKMGGGRRRIGVVGNLPYYITAPILFRLAEHRGLFKEALFTVQKEVADRLAASPGTKNYGRLTLTFRYLADAEQVFHIPASCFTPQPEVDSSVIKVKLHKPAPKSKPAEEALFFSLVKTAFSQRRKKLLPLLAKDPQLKVTKAGLSKLFDRLGIPHDTRGEALLLKDFLALAKHL